ncbi:MAG TPA: PAS domain S-box protein [Aggregatilineales bacterium]|nr:PAS domain S-box protein [Aggregatilineales bacterium]
MSSSSSNRGADQASYASHERMWQAVESRLAEAGQPVPDTIRRLLQDLLARQIEMEQQNEELRRTQAELQQHVEARMAELQLANQALQEEIAERQQVEESLRQSERRFRRIFEHAAIGMAQLSPEGYWQRVNDRLCEITGYSREEMLQLNFREITHPDDLVGDVALLERAFAGELDTLSRDKRYIRKDGEVIWVRVTVTIIRNEDGSPRHLISVTEDITERHLFQQREQEQRELAEALRRTTAALVRRLELDDVLEQIIVSLDRVVPYDAVAITLIEDDSLRMVRSRGFDRYDNDLTDTLELPGEQLQQLKAVTSTAGPLIMHNVKERSGWPNLPSLSWARSYLGAPITLDENVIGFIHLVSAEERFFNRQHADRLQAFADSVAIAIRNAQLYEQAEELAATKERARIANDLHDAVSQTLFSANMIADALPYLWEKALESVPEQLAKLRERTASALAEMRALLLELRPLELEHIELKGAIAQLVQSINGRMKTPVTLEVSGECVAEALPTEVKVAFYRIAQEALNNVAKHVSTECAGVNLTCHEGGVRLTVWDEGEGFDVQAVPPGHMGLRIMRERAEAAGAAFSLVSQPGAGTQITVEWSPSPRKLESNG